MSEEGYKKNIEDFSRALNACLASIDDIPSEELQEKFSRMIDLLISTRKSTKEKISILRYLYDAMNVVYEYLEKQKVAKNKSK